MRDPNTVRYTPCIVVQKNGLGRTLCPNCGKEHMDRVVTNFVSYYSRSPDNFNFQGILESCNYSYLEYKEYTQWCFDCVEVDHLLPQDAGFWEFMNRLDKSVKEHYDARAKVA